MNTVLKKFVTQVDLTQVPQHQLTQLAELIVLECVSIVDNRGAHMRFNHLANAIRKHWGICES